MPHDSMLQSCFTVMFLTSDRWINQRSEWDFGSCESYWRLTAHFCRVIAAHGLLALGRSMKPHVSSHRLHNISVDQVDWIQPPTWKSYRCEAWDGPSSGDMSRFALVKMKWFVEANPCPAPRTLSPWQLKSWQSTMVGWTQANEEDIHVPHASAAPPPPPSLSSYICLILQCTHSPSLLHDTVDDMMAPPGSALYYRVYNETYNCLRPAHLHTSVPPSKAQKLITRYLLLL